MCHSHSVYKERWSPLHYTHYVKRLIPMPWISRGGHWPMYSRSSFAASAYYKVSGKVLSSLRDFLFSVSTFCLLIWLPLRKFMAYSFTVRSVVANPVKKV